MYLTFYDIASSMGLKQVISKLLPLEDIVVHEQKKNVGGGSGK